MNHYNVTITYQTADVFEKEYLCDDSYQAVLFATDDASQMLDYTDLNIKKIDVTRIR